MAVLTVACPFVEMAKARKANIVGQRKCIVNGDSGERFSYPFQLLRRSLLFWDAFRFRFATWRIEIELGLPFYATLIIKLVIFAAVYAAVLAGLHFYPAIP
jgi:hypothetical protein